MTTLFFFNPYAEIRQTKNRLPHWQQNGVVYFITFRLADSIPESCVLSGLNNARFGSAYIRSHGLRKLNANIMNASPARSSGGWMPGTARVF